MKTKHNRTANGFDLDKHTPGPWEIQWGGHSFPMIVQAGLPRPAHDYDPEAICTVLQYGATRPFEMNAHLIAAAPELLEALERTLPWLAKALAENIQHGTAMPRDLEMALDQANAAIAKAKGA